MSGIKLISQAFTSARAQNRAALMPYFTLGYPTADLSLDIIASIAAAGADLIELGIPFSDPLADGPTIQRSTQVALENGMNVRTCLDLVLSLRHRGVTQPLLLMGYYNPMLAYGVPGFAAAAAEAGADGFIIPDLPPEEAHEMESLCRDHQLALVHMLAPTSTDDRIQTATDRSSGFVYLVSLTGVTGARKELPSGLQAFISQVKQVAKLPVAVGFGISTPVQARAVGSIADGIIVGSALINAVDQGEDPRQAAQAFTRALRSALENGE